MATYKKNKEEETIRHNQSTWDLSAVIYYLPVGGTRSVMDCSVSLYGNHTLEDEGNPLRMCAGLGCSRRRGAVHSKPELGVTKQTDSQVDPWRIVTPYLVNGWVMLMCINEGKPVSSFRQTT